MRPSMKAAIALGAWMRYGYRLKPIVDPSQKDACGNPARIGIMEIDAEQAKVVAEIFEGFARGYSYLTAVPLRDTAKSAPF